MNFSDFNKVDEKDIKLLKVLNILEKKYKYYKLQEKYYRSLSVYCNAHKYEIKSETIEEILIKLKNDKII